MWKFKLVDGKIAMDDKGNPIVIKPDGTEISYDINATTTTIANLQAESKTHREGKEAAETKLQAFKDIDPAKAKEALDKLKNVDLSKMVEAGKLDEVRKEITTAFEAKLTEANEKFGKLQSNFHKTVKENIFNKSAFIKDKLIVPPDMIMAVFGDRIEINNETGAAVFKDTNGSPMHSADRPGELATADEAIAGWVKGYANGPAITKGNNQSGSGSQGNGGGNNNGGKTVYSRKEFDALDAGTKMKVATDTAKFQIVD